MRLCPRYVLFSQDWGIDIDLPGDLGEADM
jgi:hypothetical protein